MDRRSNRQGHHSLQVRGKGGHDDTSRGSLPERPHRPSVRSPHMVALLGAIRHLGLSGDHAIEGDLGDDYSEVSAEGDAAAKLVRDALGQWIHAHTVSARMAHMKQEATRVAVIDLDGVIADVRHRLPLIEQTPKDWDGFFAACVNDPVLPEGLEMIEQLAREHRIVYLSGRPESCRTSTQEWLDRVGAPPGELHLRRGHDRRPARIAKVEMLKEIDGEIAIVVDDNVSVLKAIAAAGFPTYHAEWMSDSPTLFSIQENGES